MGILRCESKFFRFTARSAQDFNDFSGLPEIQKHYQMSEEKVNPKTQENFSRLYVFTEIILIVDSIQQNPLQESAPFEYL